MEDIIAAFSERDARFIPDDVENWSVEQLLKQVREDLEVEYRYSGEVYGAHLYKAYYLLARALQLWEKHE